MVKDKYKKNKNSLKHTTQARERISETMKFATLAPDSSQNKRPTTANLTSSNPLNDKLEK